MRNYKAVENGVKQIKEFFGIDSRVEYFEFLPGRVVFKVWHNISVKKYTAKVEGDLQFDGKLWDIKECE